TAANLCKDCALGVAATRKQAFDALNACNVCDAPIEHPNPMGYCDEHLREIGATEYLAKRRKQANQAPWDDFGSESEFENWLGYQSRITESEQPGEPPFEYWV